MPDGFIPSLYVAIAFTAGFCQWIVLGAAEGKKLSDERQVMIFLYSVFWPLGLCRLAGAYLFGLAAAYWRFINGARK